MPYSRHTWECGESITASRLNNIEDGIEEALACCADKGYECTESFTLLTNETVTTVEDGDYSISTIPYASKITADTIKVTFDGTEYLCTIDGYDEMNCYGGVSLVDGAQVIDFSDYPFGITSDSSSVFNTIYTETAGSHTIKIEASEVSVETSDCFKKAVKDVSGCSEPLVVNVDLETSELDKTWNEINEAFPNVYIADANGGKTAIKGVYNDGTEYGVETANIVYTTGESDGYPAHELT